MRIHIISTKDFEILKNCVTAFFPTAVITSKSADITADLDMILAEDTLPDNFPDLEKAKNLGVKILSKAQFLYQQCANRTRVVVAGRGGAKYIVPMVLHTMNFYNLPISYFSDNQYVTNGNHFDNSSEFVLIQAEENLENYHPTLALISDISEEKEKYANFVDSITKGGILIYNQEDDFLNEITQKTENPIRKIAYQTPDYQLVNDDVFLITDEGELPLNNLHKSDIINIEGAKWLCQNMGIDPADFYEALVSFDFNL